MARASRAENALSSSTIRRLLSARASNAACASAILATPCVRPATSAGLQASYRKALTRRQGRGTGRRVGGALRSTFKRGARPNDPHEGAARRRLGVAERDLRPAALDQGLGDEQPEPEAAAAFALPAVSAAGGDVGLAHAEQDLGGKARTVVADLDEDLITRPPRLDGDLAGGEVDGVVDKVVEPVHHAGAAPAFRLGALPGPDHLHGDLERAVRADDLLHEMRHRDGLEEPLLVLPEGGQLRQDAAA